MHHDPFHADRSGTDYHPVQVRKALGLKPRQRLSYELVEGGVLIRPETETLMDLAGSLKSDRGPFTKQQVEEGLAEDVAGRQPPDPAG